MKTAKARRHSNLRPKHKHTKEYLKHYYPFLPLLLSLGVLITVVMNPIVEGHKKAVLAVATDVTQTSLLDATNSARKDNGASKLVLNSLLVRAAQNKAEDMVARNYWSHVTPDGKQPWAFVAAVGYDYEKAGENLAFGFDKSSDVVDGWMNSQAHRTNMLNKDFTEVGFGSANSPNFNGSGPSTVVVAMYASPAKLSATGLSSAKLTKDTDQVQTSSNKAINRLQLMATSPWLTYLVALCLGAGTMYLIVTHSIGIKRGLRKGEKFVIHHPLFDSFVILAVAGAILLLRHAGYIL